MKTRLLTALAGAMLLGMSMSSSAATMSQTDYKAARTTISDQYSADKTACKVHAANAKDICMEEAKGKERIAKAELEASYNPSEKHSYSLRMARADAVYDIAKEKCDDASGNAKDVCRKEAKSAHVSAKANAKLVERTVDNNTTESDKINAAYAVAKEKCDAFAGDVKSSCVRTAKGQYGQN